MSSTKFSCSLASLISSTAAAISTSIIVDHEYGFVARFFQTLKADMIHDAAWGQSEAKQPYVPNWASYIVQSVHGYVPRNLRICAVSRLRKTRVRNLKKRKRLLARCL